VKRAEGRRERYDSGGEDRSSTIDGAGCRIGLGCEISLESVLLATMISAVLRQAAALLFFFSYIHFILV
jgi:hypothetical protein